MVDNLEITSEKKRPSLFTKVSWSLVISFFALILSGMSYLNSRTATIIAENAYESQFNVFWNLKVIKEDGKDFLSFVELEGDQKPRHLMVIYPYSVTMDYWIASKNDYQVPISDLNVRLSETVKEELNWLHNKAQTEGLFFTLSLPIGVYTRFTESGEIREDFSIYELMFDLEYDKADGSHEIVYGNAVYSDRLSKERMKTETFEPGMASSYLNVIWKSGLANRNKIYRNELDEMATGLSK